MEVSRQKSDCNLAVTHKLTRRQSCLTKPKHMLSALRITCRKQSHKSGFWDFEKEKDCEGGKALYRENSLTVSLLWSPWASCSTCVRRKESEKKTERGKAIHHSWTGEAKEKVERPGSPATQKGDLRVFCSSNYCISKSSPFGHYPHTQ